jgi:hypothetical protein
VLAKRDRRPGRHGKAGARQDRLQGRESGRAGRASRSGLAGGRDPARMHADDQRASQREQAAGAGQQAQRDRAALCAWAKRRFGAGFRARAAHCRSAAPAGRRGVRTRGSARTRLSRPQITRAAPARLPRRQGVEHRSDHACLPFKMSSGPSGGSRKTTAELKASGADFRTSSRIFCGLSQAAGAAAGAWLQCLHRPAIHHPANERSTIMNVLKHMEAAFLFSLSVAGAASVAIDAIPPAQASVPVQAEAAAQPSMQVVHISAKRMTAAEKRQSLQAERAGSPT